MRTRLPLALFVAFCLSLLAPGGAAHARRTSKIDTVGIEALDEVFSAAREIDNTVIKGQRQRRLAREEVNASLGLGKKTPFSSALDTLRRRAPDTLRLQVAEGLPQLVAKKTLSSDMQASVSAVNSAVSRYTRIVGQLVTLPASCQRLITSLHGLNPDSLGLTSPETALAHLTRISTYKTNVQVISKLPKKVQKLIGNLRADIQSVKATFRR